MKYERLTERDENGIATYKHKCDADSFEENLYIHAKREEAVVKRLADLEDKIERGELVENTVVTYVNMGRSNSKTLIDKALKYDELKAKIENGTLMEIDKPFVKPTKIGKYLLCKATVVWIEAYNTKAEAEEKLKGLIKNEE